MVTRNLIGGIFFCFVWFALATAGGLMFGTHASPASAQPASSSVVCGIDTTEYGSGVVSCDGTITAWADGHNNTHIVEDSNEQRVTTTHENGIVSELTVNKADGTLTSYVG